MTVRCFATALPGLGTVLHAELTTMFGTRDSSPPERDGRNDIVPFGAPAPALLSPRCSEDVFASIGTARVEGNAASTLDRLFGAEALQQAISVRATLGRPLRNPVTFRVVVRLRDEHIYRRSELRDAAQTRLLRDHRRWRLADPAALELWITESRPGRLRCGLRLSDAGMRHRHGRATERSAALRPTIAAAMVRLAGESPGVLIDPCCGSGTILGEAAAAGWDASGGDVDPAAVRAARSNLPPAVNLWQGDAARLPLRDRRAAAVVSNLPFGTRLASMPDATLLATMREARRVLRSAGSVVLLHPNSAALQRATAAAGLEPRRRLGVEVLGHRTDLAVYRAR